MSNNTSDSELIDRTQVQAIIGKSAKTVSRWIKNGRLSAPEKQGGRLVWQRRTVEADIARLGLARTEAAQPNAACSAEGGVA